MAAVTVVNGSTSNTSTPRKQTKDDRQEQDGKETLSLAHYILVTPFAALYIVGRAIMDTLRYSIYFTLWSIECSIPYIDDCLFDFVTITLPKSCSKIEQWWLQQGKPACFRTKIYLQQHSIPNTIDGLEVFFVGTYNVVCAAQAWTLEFIAVWNRFINRHDWHQLATDLSNIAYTTFWVPIVWIVTRTTHLCQIVYAGIRATVISITSEIHWILTVAIPAIHSYMISTRLAKILYQCFSCLNQQIQRICLLVFEYILSPTLGRLLTWTVKAIDSIIVLLQEHTIQAKLIHLYRYIAPNIVWVVLDISSLLVSSSLGARLLHFELIYPTYQLMMKHLMPRLAIAYQTMVSGLYRWYEAHLYPTWLNVYPYLNTPLYWIYTNLTVPVYREVYICLAATSHYLRQHLVTHIWTAMLQLIQVFATCAQRIHSFVQVWLTKQAPVLARIIRASYERVIHSCDWDRFQRDVATMITLFYDWVAEQSNVLYLSLERSLVTWANEQEDTLQMKKPTTDSITMKKLP